MLRSSPIVRAGCGAADSFLAQLSSLPFGVVDASSVSPLLRVIDTLLRPTTMLIVLPVLCAMQ